MAAQAPPAVTPAARSARIKRGARELGFDSAGIADLSPIPHADALDRWLAGGLAGTMRYMHRQAARRRAPATIVRGAARAVVVTRNYYQADPPAAPRSGRIAKYARGLDYHASLAPPLERLATLVRSLGPSGTIARPFVDAGPVPERELAQRAGLGWIGKNTMLIDPQRGSYLFLATVLTDLDVAVDPPFTADRCGTCTRCLDACPTGAFAEARVLDATKCVAYLTIEHRGPAPPDLAPSMGDWVFGCDVCQDACPWNGKFARPGTGADLAIEPGHAWVPLDEFASLSDAAFAERYGSTPLARPGLEGMRRNARIAAANLQRESGCPTP
jgi:epoxyqueuosine reductase